MADNNRDVESFALGLILAVLLYLVWTSRFWKRGGHGAFPNLSGSSAGPGPNQAGGCGCGGGKVGNYSEAPISLGGQSLSGYPQGPGASPGGALPFAPQIVGTEGRVTQGYGVQ
jgi:hypothetical protein